MDISIKTDRTVSASKTVITSITKGGSSNINQDISGFSYALGGFGISTSPEGISGKNLGCLLNIFLSFTLSPHIIEN